MPGDILHIQAGTVMPADCRIISSQGLTVDHSFIPSCLNANSGPTKLRAEPDEEDSSLHRANCAALAASAVVGGSGLGLVTRTGESVVGMVLLRQYCNLGWADFVSLALG